MIPYKDDNPTHIFPYVTIGIITLNILIFLFQVASPSDMEKLAYAYGAIPNYILTFEAVQPIHPALTIFSAMFMHGGVFHLAGNMLYLWIFGNNIEDKLGHLRFIIFYIFCGIASAYAHAITEPHSFIPMIGASGAVSGVLGAYLLLFPRAGIYTLIFLGFFVQVVKIPAFIVIGFWAVIQFVNGLISTGLVKEGGVAWFAHIGGFLIGLLTIRLWLPRRTK
ncbi:MAG: rhomboid family intramembrane serine protease [Thermodesulfovibrionales bacterium]|nr:rhomboid family intramembrane serine protease [Thermodesulfovibrionales bacterium]